MFTIQAPFDAGTDEGGDKNQIKKALFKRRKPLCMDQHNYFIFRLPYDSINCIRFKGTGLNQAISAPEGAPPAISSMLSHGCNTGQYKII
jgi:hypothetical protein